VSHFVHNRLFGDEEACHEDFERIHFMSRLEVKHVNCNVQKLEAFVDNLVFSTNVVSCLA